jgi:hypothetical protein
MYSPRGSRPESNNVVKEGNMSENEGLATEAGATPEAAGAGPVTNEGDANVAPGADGEAAAGDVEAGKGQEAEVDERGVPLKNVDAEWKRKREDDHKMIVAVVEQNKKLLEILQAAAMQTPAKEQAASSVQSPDFTTPPIDESFFKSDEYEVHPGLAKKLVEATNKVADWQIRKFVHEYQRKTQESSNAVQQFQKERGKWLARAVKDFGDKGSDGSTQIEQSSKLFQEANKIYLADPELKNIPNGEYIAYARAKANLLSQPKPATGNAALRRVAGAQGGSAPGGGVGSGLLNAKGEFYRDLSDAEYDKLTPEQKDKYDRWSIKA